MPSKNERLKNSRLYLILDKTSCGSRDMEFILQSALKGGVDLVQLRDKISPTKTMIEQARPLLKIARRYRVPFLINDRIDVCLAIDADGIHLGQDDLPLSSAKKILGKRKIIGLSCHSADDIKKGEKAAADYLAFGPVFKTATKPQTPPKGLAAFKKIRKITRRPLFAIGGITEKSLKRFMGLKGVRIAVCRQLCRALKITETTKRLKEELSHV